MPLLGTVLSHGGKGIVGYAADRPHDYLVLMGLEKGEGNSEPCSREAGTSVRGCPLPCLKEPSATIPLSVVAGVFLFSAEFADSPCLPADGLLEPRVLVVEGSENR